MEIADIYATFFLCKININKRVSEHIQKFHYLETFYELDISDASFNVYKNVIKEHFNLLGVQFIYNMES